MPGKASASASVAIQIPQTNKLNAPARQWQMASVPIKFSFHPKTVKTQIDGDYFPGIPP